MDEHEKSMRRHWAKVPSVQTLMNMRQNMAKYAQGKRDEAGRLMAEVARLEAELSRMDTYIAERRKKDEHGSE